ncbi:RDD family protein [Actinoallomurus spadix]|uniref:RDD family protein n=1 Tax=Actinoallomurus spadix TaxID=79912 RepID=UPI0020932DCA|nr:RDD family protein [Actinoallomurus spadix]MCO5991047.1 RDD family protein [Actinoallomurus spadix]
MTERRRSIGSWIEGARAAGVELGYPGERMGLPREGAGSVAGYGRRLGALVLDWVIALAIAAVLAGALHVGAQTRSLLTLLVFGVMAWLLTGSIGTTVGKRLCGLRVVRVGGGPVGPLWAFVRALLLVLVVPALIWDRDHRGLHDRAANAVVVRI